MPHDELTLYDLVKLCHRRSYMLDIQHVVPHFFRRVMLCHHRIVVVVSVVSKDLED